MKNYEPKNIEKKWQDIWDEKKPFKCEINDKEKFYALIEFPYPSGQGLHVGHPRPYTALDVVSRKRRLEGQNVLFTMGWDAFGLPTENYAMKNKIHPEIVTKNNIKNFKKQLKSIGFSFDWDREINTTDPDYYKWTQWIFIQLYKHGLAYKATMPINFCTGCKVGLANEEVVNGVCERCGSKVVQKEKEQWMLRMSDYAEDLIQGLDNTNFSKRVKLGQINWIGKSAGAEIDFEIEGTDEKLKVYTTRPDTIYGATFMVIAPEHPILETLKDKITNMDEIKKYKEYAKTKTEFERTELAKEKTGVKIEGIKAINPFTNKEIQIWTADYVMMSYGTGAIMAVPAHDDRDYEFATKFNIDIIPVIEGDSLPYIGEGKYINSDILNGMTNKEEAIKKMIDEITKRKIGNSKVNYRLQDWIFSRQRFWGEPIPLVYCEHCGWQPVKEEDLPVLLPDVANYEPTEDGESPLANIEKWVNTTCPKCGGKAKRETDTMPNWAGSSWYFLRYMDPHNDKEFVSKDALNYWGRVDWYDGGMEHTARHLLYARFWNQFLYNIGLVPNKEPIDIRTSHGMILGPDGEKMSKSKGNVINPHDMVVEYGADALRLYEMFIGDYEKDAAWSTNSLKGCKRFLDRVWKIGDKLNDKDGYTNESLVHKTIKKVTNDIKSMKFNTAISALMIMLNAYDDMETITKDDLRVLLLLLNPFSPHITEEINEKYNLGNPLCESEWPKYDEEKTTDDTYELVFQVNGKVRGKETVNSDITKEEMETLAKSNTNVQKFISDKEIVKVITIPGRLVNIVVK